MSLPKDVETRISQALQELRISDEMAGKVSPAVEKVAQTLQQDIVPLSHVYHGLSGLSAKGQRRDIIHQIDQVLENKIGLKTYPELASQLAEGESLALLIWRGDLVSISGSEVQPATLQLGILEGTSMLFGRRVMHSKVANLAEVTGEGELTVKGPAAGSRETFIFDSSPVIKLIK